jgi:PST family polysaccharide transporter
MSWRGWHDLAPKSLRRGIEEAPRVGAALSNIAWIYGDNLLRTGVRVILSVWVARYLGPEQFGLLSYAVALASLFAIFASLELSIAVVRDLVKEQDAAGEILGSAFLLQVLGSLIGFVLLIQFT